MVWQEKRVHHHSYVFRKKRGATDVAALIALLLCLLVAVLKMLSQPLSHIEATGVWPCILARGFVSLISKGEGMLPISMTLSGHPCKMPFVATKKVHIQRVSWAYIPDKALCVPRCMPWSSAMRWYEVKTFDVVKPKTLEACTHNLV